MKYYIIDALGPFINSEKPPENWSKIPFEQYEKLENPTKEFGEIVNNFRIFVKKIKDIGYNAISLDDLAHIVILDFYNQVLKNKLKHFQKLYSELIDICNKEELAVFINFDIFYSNKDINSFTKGKDKKILDVIKSSLQFLFDNYDVKGVITRIGESDGIDVQGLFKSKITIKSPKQARTYLDNLLPLFEKNNKKWIFRTWTVGSGKIGDLIWNKKTFWKVFKDINSSNLIISMKYGVSDFFQNLKLNKLFYESGHQKIIELQAKKEYDLFGEIPIYTGFQYEKYFNDLKNNPNIKGIMIWCQTGGWAKSNRITFLNKSSEYVELNTISTINIFKGSNAKTELEKFYQDDPKKGLFIEKYNNLYTKMVYPQDDKEYFFKKVYVPATSWLYWNNITITALTQALVLLIYKKTPSIDEKELDDLYILGKEGGFENISFYIETLKILYFIRKYFHGEITFEIIEQKIMNYSDKYNFLRFNLSKNKNLVIIKIILSLLIRDNQNYRLLDKFLLNRYIILFFYKFIMIFHKNSLPRFVNKQAVPILKIIK